MTETVGEILGSKFLLRKMDAGYVHVLWSENAEVAENDALAVIRALREVAGDERMPLLVDMRSMRSIEKSARAHFGNTDVVDRVAMLVGTALSRTVGSFYLGLTRNLFSARMFDDEKEAVDWLLDEQD